MKRLLVIALSLLLSRVALADDFTGSRLFVNQGVRQKLDRMVGVGLNVSIAPVKVAEKKALDAFEASDPATYGAVVEGAKYVKAEDLEGLSARALKDKLKALPQLSADQKKQIEALPVSDSDTKMVADLVRIIQDPDKATSFSFEPFCELHFDWLDVTLTVPLAGFAADETDFALGNIGLGLRSGVSFGAGVKGALAYGLDLWTPSGSTKANALGLANLLWSPRYFHEYFTGTTWLAGGLDLWFVTLQANIAYDAMFAVRDDPFYDQVHFLQYGASLSITAIPFIIISTELSGLADVKNASAYDSVYLTSGLRFSSSYIDIGLGFQVPLKQGSSSDFASFSDVSFGSPSDFNVILSALIGI